MASALVEAAAKTGSGSRPSRLGFFFDLSVGPCPDFLTTNTHTSERSLLIRSNFRNVNGDILEQPSGLFALGPKGGVKVAVNSLGEPLFRLVFAA